MRTIIAAALVVATSAGCGGSSTKGSATTIKQETLTVLAASSLTEPFTALGAAFERSHAGVKVALSFAASSALAEQVVEGGPGDVIVTADRANLAKVGAAAGAPTVIARNRLTILVAKENPKRITGLRDLGRAGVVLVLCAVAVPCGKLGALALAKAGVVARPASLEDNVKAVVAKVTLGEADAGIVYVTDVRAVAGKADGVAIDIAGDPALEAVYPMAVLKTSAHAALARAWIAFVASSEGQSVLAAHGFLSP
ncbi:MAG: molybdate transport system substrate-binding protein [Actinomycetota bacterium]|nr:molybdate transport system substrate-binding protein [Actinomycetota bacterium]